jgi:O-acetyl-ADP-ribose deacetylase (regulator of RNase III)
MTGDEQSGGTVRFGRTVLQAVEGKLSGQTADALVIVANARGVLGMSGVRLVAGADVEREAMSRAPLAIGSAIMTAPGDLADRGVRAIIHCVVSEMLGQPVRPEDLRRSIPAVLRLAEEQRFATLALPVIGSGSGPDQLATPLAAAIIVEEIVAHLRRVASRIERILIVSRSADDVATLRDVLLLAREQAWELPR